MEHLRREAEAFDKAPKYTKDSSKIDRQLAKATTKSEIKRLKSLKKRFENAPNQITKQAYANARQALSDYQSGKRKMSPRAALELRGEIGLMELFYRPDLGLIMEPQITPAEKKYLKDRRLTFSNNLAMSLVPFTAILGVPTRWAGGSEEQVAGAIETAANIGGLGAMRRMGAGTTYRPDQYTRSRHPNSSLDINHKTYRNNNESTSNKNKPLPDGGESIKSRIDQGKSVPKHAKNNPEDYFYDPKAGKYKKIPDPKPDFSKGNSDRKIPCFAAGTLIATPDRLVKIESLKVGDIVSSWDTSLEKTVNNRVTALHRNKAVDWIEIFISNHSIKCTKNHHFWLPKIKKWIAAKHLSKGMTLLLENGNSTEVINVNSHTTKEEPTYNLTVENTHCYFVGPKKILAHNDENTKNGKIYIGFDKNNSEIYVGQTVQSLKDRQKQHRAEGITKPDTKAWKADMTIKQHPGLDGLTADEMDYHERRVYDALKAKGANLKNSQIPLTDEKTNKLIKKYC